MSSGSNSLEQNCQRLETQISTLKHVASLRKSLLGLRERQVKDLISKLKFYETIVEEERAQRHNLNSRLETAEAQCAELTEKLAQNDHTIEETKTNYENKVSTLINELQISEQRNQQLSDQLNCAQLRISEVTKDFTMEDLNRQLEEKDRFARELQKQLARAWERNKILSYQMSMLNTLFNETEGVTIDFEKIKAIGDIVRESQSFAEETEEEVMSDDLNSNAARRPSVDLENLLDSIGNSESDLPAEIPGEESCYKSVDTKRGPELVLSVSRTFIKLKDLIVEKKSLQKEIDTLKNLNTKLESKVDKQEHRLYRVTMELNKTWSLVSKLKQQHKRLYNSEAVLRYELQEKRTLLEKLKNELSSSREKWRRVRQKNSQSQIEWEKLRDEFAQRKHQSSQESGTFSEVMSVSSGENDVTVEEDEEATSVQRRSCKLGRPKSLPLPINGTSDRVSSTDVEEVVEDIPEEEDDEDVACAMSRTDDEPLDSEDPLEDLVADLVEDIDNEADTEEEASSSIPPVENDSSPSPDFEDRMRRRANRLRMLEEQCHVLHQRLLASTARSEVMSTKLAQLHDHYGPSGSSTGTPSDEQPHDHGDDTSQIQDEAHAIVPTEDETSTSTDTAYVSGTEKENNSREDLKPELVTQSDPLQDRTNCPEMSAPNSEELINASQNSNINEASPSTSTENNIPTNDAIQQTQGHHCISELSTTTVANQVRDASDDDIMQIVPIQIQDDLSPQVIVPLLPNITSSPPPDIPMKSQDPESNESGTSNQSDITQPSEQSRVTEEEQQQHQPSQQQHESDTPEIQQAAEVQLEEVVPIQETAVVQHFPSTTEEEANEFAAVQIRPEFLRILQEADEATNANSLDWMPTLLTITHNVALLRLDPEIPSSQNAENSRSLSESLRIEIPRQSPSPPPARPPVPAIRSRREPHAHASTDSHTEDTSAEEGDEPMPAYAKDPGFLSRLIIKQLPKRLQLLKNENHTLQMEKVEAKMRMKEIKRQLEKQQELSITLDAQIEDKNLIEFELREEMEKKEKVIEELQMEIDDSRDYLEELKKEKDDMEAYYKLLLEEKTDMDQRKAPLESAKTCNNCRRTFNIISRRKSHCKICGKIFCKDCAIPREPNKRSQKRPRLCTRCHLRRQRLAVLVSESRQSAEQLS